MQVVSNTSPLSALSIIGRLGLLRAQCELKFEMDRLVQDAGFFVSGRVRNTFLAEAGEVP